MTMRDLTLQLGWTSFHLRVHDEAEPCFAPILAFFRDSVTNGTPDAPHFVVDVSRWDPELLAFVSRRGEQIVLRRSSAAPFNFDVWRLRHGDRRLYANSATILDVPASCCGDGDFLRLHVSEGSCHQVVDNLRDLAWRHEEHRGRVVLHAAGVSRDGEVVAIAGSKGAGKTTTMLTALRNQAWWYFSGDKVICDVTADGVIAAPWPDWPYVGVGTIRTHPLLEESVREIDPALEERAPNDKLLLDPQLFSKLFPAIPLASRLPLTSMLLPRVDPGAGLSSRVVMDQAEKEANLLRVVDRTSDTTFFTAQLHLVPSYAGMYRTIERMRPLLAGVDFVEVTGDLHQLDLDDVLPEREPGGPR